MSILNEPMTLNEIMNALTSGYFPGFKDCDSYAILNTSMNNVFADQDDTFFGIADDIGLHNIVFANKEGYLESTYRDNIDKNVLDSSRIFALSIPRSEINNKLCAYIRKEISKEDLYSTVFEEKLYSWDQLQFSNKVICEIDESVIPSMIESSIYQNFMVPNSNGNWNNLITLKEYKQSEIYPGFYVEADQNKTIMEQILIGGSYYTDIVNEGVNTEITKEYINSLKEYTRYLRNANILLKNEEYDKCLREFANAKRSLQKSRRELESMDSTTFEAVLGFVITTLLNNFKDIIASGTGLMLNLGVAKVTITTVSNLAADVAKGEQINFKTIFSSIEQTIFGEIIDQINLRINIRIVGYIKISFQCLIDLNKISKAKKEGDIHPNVYKINIIDNMKKLERSIEDMEDSVRKIKAYKKSLKSKK